ncbi:UNVERIFIED_ORG: hypothetical protein GGI57_003233 [Rhizobium aethiopicum]
MTRTSFDCWLAEGEADRARQAMPGLPFFSAPLTFRVTVGIGTDVFQ